jgi:hypothetical protein
MPRGTFVIIRNEFKRLRKHSQMSIGEIAMILYKSQPEVMGQVTEMSLGGLSFADHTGAVPDGDRAELDLLMTEQGIYLHNIPFATVPLEPAGKGRKKQQRVRTDAVHFKALDAVQKASLKTLLAHHVG